MNPNSSWQEEYYDPIYELIRIRSWVPEVIELEPEESPNVIPEIVESLEFARLNFLRQAGVTWLIYPSATHTRFSHSLGTYWLGFEAMNRVKVTNIDYIRNSHSVPIGTFPLVKWLSKVGLEREFFISLLLHDIGHLPLSHQLEHNKELVEALNFSNQKDRVDLSSHEERSYSIIKGEGSLAEAWKEYTKEQNSKSGLEKRNISDILAEVKGLSLPAIGYAITGNRTKYFDQCSSEGQEGQEGQEYLSRLIVMKELVSGILDLDRMDHLARDIYFSGIKSSKLKVASILNGTEIVSSDEPPNYEPEWHLSEAAVSHAVSLLLDRKQIYSLMFNDERVVSLGAMINWALSLHLRAIDDPSERHKEAIKICQQGDDEFINMLCNSKSTGARLLSKLYKNKLYYPLIQKIESNNVPLGVRQINGKIEALLTDRLEEKFNKDENSLPRVIWWVDPKVYSTDREDEFLNAQRFRIKDPHGRSFELIYDREYGPDFESLRHYHKIGYIYVFARGIDESTKSEIRQIVRDALEI